MIIFVGFSSFKKNILLESLNFNFYMVKEYLGLMRF